MSWSHHYRGNALAGARMVQLEADQVQRYLSTNHANAGELALHARAVAMIVVACHEGKEHDIAIEAYGHFDGKHNHVSIKIDGIDTPQSVPTEPIPATDGEICQSGASPDTPVPCPKCKPGKPCKAHK